jgi:succinyl-CoA synthetase beta subunit
MVALLEYQSKSLLSGAGLPVPAGTVVRSTADLGALDLTGARYAVKAQVPAKERATAGGVRIVDGAEAAREAARGLLAVTIGGHAVSSVLVEQAVDIAAEWFVCVMIDPWGPGLTVQCSAEGGTGVEARLAAGGGVAFAFGPADVPDGTVLAAAWGWSDPLRVRIADFAARLCRLALRFDLLLLEVNPLAVDSAGNLVVLDAHITADDSAEYRQAWLTDLDTDLDVAHPARAWRRRYGGDFAVTDPAGTVALLNTGAGAGMLLTDELRSLGARTFNFSDIRAGTPADREERFGAAIDLILSGERVDTVLICIHAGITDLREIGDLLVRSVERLNAARRQVVVRLEGPHSLEASRPLSGRPDVVVQSDLRRAVEATAALTRRTGIA